MTENFKNVLFKYFVGNLKRGNGIEEEIIKNVTEKIKSKWDGFLPDNEEFHFNGLIQSSTNDYLVIYGEYIEKNGTFSENSSGIVLILDSEFNPLKSIYEFESGTKLRPIQCMIQDDDGLFVAIDSIYYTNVIDLKNNVASEKRFIMLNDISSKDVVENDFSIILRKTYIFEKNYLNFRCVEIYKNPNSAHYLLIGLKYIDKGLSHFDGVSIIDLKINVGSENNWNLITDDGTNWLFGGSYCEFDNNDNAFWQIVLTHNTGSEVSINLWTKNFDNSISVVKIFEDKDSPAYVDSVAMNNQCVFLNKNEFYFVVNNERWGPEIQSRYLKLYKYNIITSKLLLIKSFYLGDGDWNLFRDAIFLQSLNNELYLYYCKVKDNVYVADYYFQRLTNDIWNPILIAENKPYFMEYRLFYLSGKFNLVKASIFPTSLDSRTWEFLSVKENYNSLNYNGREYIDTNALIPFSAELYSSNELVFARNLYNKTINNNTTVATVEVPNNYLNDVDITSKCLYSETNLKLIKDNNTLQKNVYETMFINFINTIIVSNEKRNNVNASIYLNQAINETNFYNNARLCDKARLSYQNGESKWLSYEIIDVTDTSLNIVIAIFVDKLINQIEFISNDKKIVYQHIDLSSLEIGKIYKIKQKLEVA